MKVRVIVPCYNEGEVVLKTYDKLTEIMSKDSSVKTMNTIYYLLMMVARTLRLTIYKILLLTIAMLSFYHLVEISEKKLQ